MFDRWNPNIKGIHVIQHFPLDGDEGVPVKVANKIKELENPIAVAVCLRNRPGTAYRHVVKQTDRPRYSKEMAIKNVLSKYPMTELIVLEGGLNMVLYSSRPFGSNNE